jgi:hypothetical protein
MRINKLYKYEVCLSRSSERRTCHEHWPEGLPEALVVCVNKKSVVLGKGGGRASMVVISGLESLEKPRHNDFLATTSLSYAR